MRKTDKILLALLSAAIGSQPEGCGLAEVTAQEWREVIDLAFEQGVAGIAFEAAERLALRQAQGPEIGPDSDTLMEWFGQVEYQKTEYRERLAVAARFAAELEKAGVRTSVLKGAAFARYYRQPELRYSCDFDCVLSDFELGNQVAERLGAEVDRAEQKHSHIQLDGIHIENHQTCTGADSNGLEGYLAQMLFRPGCAKVGASALELPPLMFDALFCLYHAKTHFVVEEGIELRHVADWALIRRELVKQGLYDAFVLDAERFGMQKFLLPLNGVADMVEGRKAADGLTESERLMWEDIMRQRKPVARSKGWLQARLSVLRQMKRNGWKYRLYTDTTARKAILDSLRRYVMRVVKRPEVVKYMFVRKSKRR